MTLGPDGPPGPTFRHPSLTEASLGSISESQIPLCVRSGFRGGIGSAFIYQLIGRSSKITFRGVESLRPLRASRFSMARRYVSALSGASGKTVSSLPWCAPLIQWDLAARRLLAKLGRNCRRLLGTWGRKASRAAPSPRPAAALSAKPGRCRRSMRAPSTFSISRTVASSASAVNENA